MYIGNLWHSAGLNKTDKLRSVLLSNFASLDYDALKMRDKYDQMIYNQIDDSNEVFTKINNKVVFVD